MSSSQKIAFSFLITIILVVAFIFTARSTNLFKILDDTYYSQTIIKEKNNNLNKIAENLDSYIKNIISQLEDGENAFINQESVRSYMSQNPSEALIVKRRNLTAQLFEDNPAILGIRIVDKNGKSVHYSSFEDDVLKVNGNLKTYKNYPEIVKEFGEIDFGQIKVNKIELNHEIFVDSKKNRIILAVPFYWIQENYAATLICYLNFNDIERELVDKNIISLGENIKLISENLSGGILTGLPNIPQTDFEKPIIEKLRISHSYNKPEKILQIDENSFWVLLSTDVCEKIIVSGIYTSDTFKLSQELIYVIYVCTAITIFLIVFLAFSFKQNSELVLKKKLKAIQYNLVKEFLDNKEEIQWNSVLEQLKKRKNDLKTDIFSTLGIHSKKQKKHLEDFMEKEWAELFDFIETKTEKKSQKTNSETSEITVENLKNMLEQVIKETNFNINIANTSEKIENSTQNNENIKVDDMEELENIDSLDEVENLEELEDEVIENIEEIDDIEELDSLEEEINSTEDVTNNFKIDDSQIEMPFTKSFEYSESIDSFIRNEYFPTTENLFAEELGFGTEYLSNKELTEYPNFSVYELPSMIEQNDENKTKKSGLLAIASAFNEITSKEKKQNQSVVKNQNGIFQISQNLEYSQVAIDKDFKSLVDSVLKEK